MHTLFAIRMAPIFDSGVRPIEIGERFAFSAMRAGFLAVSSIVKRSILRFGRMPGEVVSWLASDVSLCGFGVPRNRSRFSAPAPAQAARIRLGHLAISALVARAKFRYEYSATTGTLFLPKVAGF